MVEPRRSRLAWRSLVGIAVLVATSTLGCGGGGGEEDPVTINWDLSASHTKEDIGEEPDPDTSHYGFRSVESVRIVLPGERVFEADDVQDIRINAEGDELEDIGVVLHPRTAEEAHARATALADDWGLRRDGLDDWLEAVRLTREANGDEADVGQALAADRTVGPAAFSPSVDIRYSFDDDKPWVVAFHMYWDPEIE